MGTLDTLVSALCADYLRRSELIRSGGLSRRVETELRYLNAKIIDATSEFAHDFEVEGFIEEIGSSVGYAKSRFDTFPRLHTKQERRR